mmetsp:Transcript_31368/g.68692  ORF Transcript_31368/g.68692 Transcript_31368/m.68692 type:complete len:328 (-) Transcript_31368:374-1357(-)
MCLLLLAEVVPEPVIFLGAIPIFHPVVETKALVVPRSGNKVVAARDGVEHWQASRGTNSIRVWGQLRALHQEGPDIRVLPKQVDALRHDSWLHLHGVDLLAISNRLETRNILTADDEEAILFRIDPALFLDQVAHWHEGFIVGRQNGDHFILVEGTCDRGQLRQGRHEHWLRSYPSRKLLEVHHESAVPSDAIDSTRTKPLDGVSELALHVRRHLARLAHLEGEAWNDAVEDIVREGVGRVNVAGRRRVVVVQPNNAKRGRGSLLVQWIHLGRGSHRDFLHRRRRRLSLVQHHLTAGRHCALSPLQQRGSPPCCHGTHLLCLRLRRH